MKKIIGAITVLSVLIPSLAFASVDLNLVGGSVTVPANHTFSEPGYSAFSTVDGDVTGLVQVSVPDLSKPGTYFVGYDVTDSALDSASASRSVTILAGGSGEIYCSSPTAPGWNVNLPNGGCGGTSNFIQHGTVYTMFGVTSVCEFFTGCMIPR